jgi:hypothetical protein
MLRFCLLVHDDMHLLCLQDVQSHALVLGLPDHTVLKEAGLAIFRLLTAKYRSRALFNASALRFMVLLLTTNKPMGAFIWPARLNQ